MSHNLEEVLTRGVEEVLPDKNSLSKLLQKKKIRVYLGIDPTGTKLHLGHTIPLRKLAQFAKLGHEAILVVGTGTVLAGDPSQRLETRKKITQAEIEENIKTWKEQAGKILDFNKIKIEYNGDWLLKLNLPEIIEIASYISAIQLFKREMFTQRLNRGDTVWLHEVLYPVLQGYDSVVLDVDLEIGGTDQTFNMLMGRELQKKMNNREKYVLTVPMITGIDGKQMSKTSGNCVWLTDTPGDMFGKLMSISDDQIVPYVTLLTDLQTEKTKSLPPLQAKKQLAAEIVRIYYSENEANKTKTEFEKVFQRRELPQDIPIFRPKGKSYGILKLLIETDLLSSRSEAKRLIREGAIEVNQIKIEDLNQNIKLKNGTVIKVGKHRFIKIKTN